MDVIGAINVRSSIQTAVDAADRARQNSEFNIQLEQNRVNATPGQNIRTDTRVDTTAPLDTTPLANPEDTGLISSQIRGNNLDISV